MAQAAHRHVIVSFHAHPDDEALYTGGTLARLSAEGHRVVLVVATAGESGLAGSESGDLPLGERRLAELTASAEVLGCARVVLLGYADSGYTDPRSLDGTADPPFAEVDVDQAAARLADILREEAADVLTVYDPAGGYGHRDHVQVHRVGVRAAERAGTPVVLEATVDRTLIRRVVRALRAIRVVLPGLTIPDADHAYTAREKITHRVDVGAFVEVKRAAMAAHVSQSTAPNGVRTLSLILRLPRPLYRRAFRYEWFVERGRTPTTPPLDDVLSSLRGGPPVDRR